MEITHWDFDQGRDYPLKYVLTDTDRKYLQTKRTSDHPASPEERISEKVDRVPDRVQDLFIDIAMLRADGRLNEESWRDILELSKSQYRIDTITGIPLTLEEKLRPTISIGHQWGRVMESLYEPVHSEIEELQEYSRSSGHDLESQWEDLLWGVALAFLGREHGQITQEEQIFDDLIAHLQRRMDERRAALSEEERDAVDQRRTNERSEVVEAISNQLTDFDLNPSPGAIRVIRKQISQDPIQEPEKFNCLVEELLDKTPFEEINTIESAIQQDIEHIENGEIQGVDAEKIFRAVVDAISSRTAYNTNKRIDRKELAEKLPGESQKNTTQALRALGKRYDHHLWPTKKIATQSEEGWGLTDYGELIAYCYFRKEGDTLWMYDPYLYAENGIEELEELTTPVIEEFFDDHYDPYWAYFYGT